MSMKFYQIVDQMYLYRISILSNITLEVMSFFYVCPGSGSVEVSHDCITDYNLTKTHFFVSSGQYWNTSHFSVSLWRVQSKKPPMCASFWKFLIKHVYTTLIPEDQMVFELCKNVLQKEVQIIVLTFLVHASWLSHW